MAADKVKSADKPSAYNEKITVDPLVTDPHYGWAANNHSGGEGGMSDVEKYGANRKSLPVPDLKRKLKSRHLQMIAIGMHDHCLNTNDTILRPVKS